MVISIQITVLRSNAAKDVFDIFHIPRLSQGPAIELLIELRQFLVDHRDFTKLLCQRKLSGRLEAIREDFVRLGGLDVLTAMRLAAMKRH